MRRLGYVAAYLAAIIAANLLLTVGGSTAWKMGAAAAGMVGAARGRGAWVHMGRVNSIRRMRYASSIGCQSVDGTKWSRYQDSYVHLLAGLPFDQSGLHRIASRDDAPARDDEAARRGSEESRHG